MPLKSRTVTRDEVAQAAQVSPATVSYVVNNGPRPVAPETRMRVLEVIQALGYRPNAIARNLRMQQSSTIGLIVPDINNPYFAEVLRGVEQKASENGLSVVSCHSDYKLERELHYVDILQTERVAGVIWIPASDSPEPATRMTGYGLPYVVLDRLVQGAEAPVLVTDIFLGAYLATKHLIDHGHRLIGCITRRVEQHHSTEKVRGFKTALSEQGIEINESLIVGVGFHMQDGYDGAKEILQQSPRPTAIFAYNDILAIGALRAAYELGLKVPEDLSIVGFDNILQAAFTCPALTTISQPKFELGSQGVDLLLDFMSQGMDTSIPNPPLPVKLIIRESTANPPNK